NDAGEPWRYRHHGDFGDAVGRRDPRGLVHAVADAAAQIGKRERREPRVQVGNKTAEHGAEQTQPEPPGDRWWPLRPPVRSARRVDMHRREPTHYRPPAVSICTS